MSEEKNSSSSSLCWLSEGSNTSQMAEWRVVLMVLLAKRTTLLRAKRSRLMQLPIHTVVLSLRMLSRCRRRRGSWAPQIAVWSPSIAWGGRCAGEFSSPGTQCSRTMTGPGWCRNKRYLNSITLSKRVLFMLTPLLFPAEVYNQLFGLPNIQLQIAFLTPVDNVVDLRLVCRSVAA